MGYGFFEGLSLIADNIKDLTDSIKDEGGIGKVVERIIEEKKEDAEIANWLNDHVSKEAATDYLSRENSVKIRTVNGTKVDQFFDDICEKMDDKICEINNTLANNYVEMYNAVSQEDWKYFFSLIPQLSNLALKCVPLKGINWDLVSKAATYGMNGLTQRNDADSVFKIDWKNIANTLLQEKMNLLTEGADIQEEDVDKIIKISQDIGNTLRK